MRVALPRPRSLGVPRDVLGRLRPLRPRGPHRLPNTVAGLLVTFLVLFPKGGIKVGSLPFTWGYLLLGLLVPSLVVATLVRGRVRVAPGTLLALLAAAPFAGVFLYSAWTNGVGETGYAAAAFLHFVVFPPVFLWLLPAWSDRVDTALFVRLLCGAVFWAAVWGLLLFFLWPVTHHLLEVPLLTVNLADYGTVAQTKHIQRGAFLKLISTYNNGNVYGIATLLLLPLYTRLESRRYRRWTVRAALFLTLARTVWAGLVLEQLLSLMPILLSNLRTLPTLRLRGAGRQLLLVAGTLAAVLVVLFSSSYGIAFLLDPTLGGRSGEISDAAAATLLPSAAVTGFTEVLLASALSIYGYLGAAALLLIIVFPVLYAMGRPAIFGDPVRRAALKGLVLYAVLSLSDGAANLIPVLAFFWFVESVLLGGLPGRPGLYARAPQTAPQAGGLRARAVGAGVAAARP